MPDAQGPIPTFLDLPAPRPQDRLLPSALFLCKNLRRAHKDEALLKVDWNGTIRPVVSLGVESGWDGGFDQTSIVLFRDWLRKRYGTIQNLTNSWKLRILSFDSVDPRDTNIFQYADYRLGKEVVSSVALEDHLEFKAQTTSETMRRIGARIREKYPEVLFLAEIAYEYEATDPDAKSYRIRWGANPSSCDYADIVLFRCVNPVSSATLSTVREKRRSLGQRFIFTFRTYESWAKTPGSIDFVSAVNACVNQSSADADGIGFYSWNEMVDVHLARPETDLPVQLMRAMLSGYLEKATFSGNFTYSYNTVFDSNATNYVIAQDGLTRLRGVETSFYKPTVAGQPGTLIMKFPFAASIQKAHLLASLSSFNFGLDLKGTGTLFGSKDGTNWITLLNAPPPPFAQPDDRLGTNRFYDADLPEGILHGKDLWLRVLLQSDNIDNLAQFSRSSGERIFELNVQFEKVPTITIPPQSQTVTSGQGVTFSVTASSSPAPTYQWRKNGANISGAVSATYSIASASANDAGAYTVVVSNSQGSVTSAAATLTVRSAAQSPTITQQPQNQTASLQGRVVFTAVGLGSGLSYQWRKNGIDLPGQNGPVLVLNNAGPADVDSYALVITNSAGSVTSSAATLSLLSLDVYPGLTIFGPPGARYRIDYSIEANAASWTALTNLTLSASPFTFTDYTAPARARRFFRAIALP